MEVRFTKLTGRRYEMAVTRERGPALAPRRGPGYDEFLPHDAVHLIVEREAGLAGGAFGRLAAGRNNIFWPADPARRRGQARWEARRPPTPAQRDDMARSEGLASVTPVLWELRAGRRDAPPAWMGTEEPSSPLIERILERLDEFATRWHALPAGGSVTLHWPRQCAPGAQTSSVRATASGVT